MASLVLLALVGCKPQKTEPTGPVDDTDSGLNAPSEHDYDGGVDYEPVDIAFLEHDVQALFDDLFNQSASTRKLRVRLQRKSPERG